MTNRVESDELEVEAVDAGLILLVDGDGEVASRYRAELESEGFSTIHSRSISDARRVIKMTRGCVDLIFLDPLLEEEAKPFFLEVRRELPQIPVVFVTGSREIEHAIFALRRGAFDYLLEPLETEDLRMAARRAVEKAQMERELSVRRALDPNLASTFDEGVFSGAAMRNIAGVIEQVKDSSVPVTVLGETGTGKEVVARLLHHRSKRRGAPFVAVNCASLPRELAESELFGHDRGAFTGADTRKAGRFVEASGGTIFLDEVGELDPAIQAKLLRVLQENEIVPLGGRPIAVDARVVVATNRNLEEDVREGRFRADLFYRLNVITIRIPPLRDRRDEIPALAAHLLDRFVRRDGLPPRALSDDALGLLERQPWPGNVRELESTLKRSALLSTRRTITAQDLVLTPSSAETAREEPELEEEAGLPRDGEPVRRLSEYERDLMMRALVETKGNVSAAARRLGIGRSTFYRRAERHKLPI